MTITEFIEAAAHNKIIQLVVLAIAERRAISTQSAETLIVSVLKCA